MTCIKVTNFNPQDPHNANYRAVNIGTGKPISIKNLVETLAKLYNKSNLKPYVSNECRKGDIRHCYADATKAQKLLRAQRFQEKTSGRRVVKSI